MLLVELIPPPLEVSANTCTMGVTVVYSLVVKTVWNTVVGITVISPATSTARPRKKRIRRFIIAIERQVHQRDSKHVWQVICAERLTSCWETLLVAATSWDANVCRVRNAEGYEKAVSRPDDSKIDLWKGKESSSTVEDEVEARADGEDCRGHSPSVAPQRAR